MSDDSRDESTEEYLLGGIGDEPGPVGDDLPEKAKSDAGDAQTAGSEAVQSEEAAGSAGAVGATDDVEPAGGPADSGYEDPPTEEIFALEARLREGDVPELDPVFRAALLESPESGAPAQGEEAGAAQPTDSGTGDVGGGEESDPATAEGVAAGAGEPDTDAGFVTEEQTAILAAAARSDVHQVIETARRSGQPYDPPRPPACGDFEEAPKGKRLWWRFALATLIIVFSFAGATSASVLNLVDDFTDRLSDPAFENIGANILPDSNGGPQTIVILGSDARTGGGAAEGDPGRSDTTILLRLDPETDQIAMLSIPRDLKVEIPGIGTDKFNAAYSYGGTKLTLQTIKALTGLQINHVVNVDFQGFASVVDAIGCVFVDVDRDYYNSNEGVAEIDQYAEIDIDAGYQKLCGPDALEFARYRHTDSDLVRASRQQDLLGEVRNRLSFSELLDRRNELIDAFADNTRSDISGSKESLELLKLLFDSRNARVVEVKFPATLGESYVTATQDEIDGAVEKFLGFEDSAGPVGTLEDGGSANAGQKNSGQDKRQKKRSRNQARKQDQAIVSGGAPGKDSDELVDASQMGIDQAALIRGPGRRGTFNTWYTKRLPAGAFYSDGSRSYHLRDPDKNAHAAYRMVMVLEAPDGNHYFGLQGIRGWEDPPILEAPHDEMKIDGRDFRVYTEGDRIRLISWFDNGDTYWLSNSLLLTLTNNQMLGMARATRVFTPN
jgi:LCP family protein required for cell wall assembly